MRLLLIDDEPPALRRLRRLVSEYPEVTGIVEARGVEESAMHWDEVDVVFLDIQLHSENGLEALSERRRHTQRLPLVVIVTAYAEFAVGAFAADAIDYLLKPVTRDRLADAMTRVQRRLSPSASTPVAPVKRSEARPVAVHDRGRLLLLHPDEIEYFTADGNYVRVHSSRGELLHRERIHELVARLDPSVFARIHRSVIVNTGAIREVRPWMNGDHLVRLASGVEVRGSRHYKHILQAHLARLGVNPRRTSATGQLHE